MDNIRLAVSVIIFGFVIWWCLGIYRRAINLKHKRDRLEDRLKMLEDKITRVAG